MAKKFEYKTITIHPKGTWFQWKIRILAMVQQNVSITPLNVKSNVKFRNLQSKIIN